MLSQVPEHKYLAPIHLAWCIKDVLPGLASHKLSIPQGLMKTFSAARGQRGWEMALTAYVQVPQLCLCAFLLIMLSYRK